MKEILLTSSVLILALLLLRLLFRKTISRRVQYALWGLVALRLLMPVNLPALRAQRADSGGAGDGPDHRPGPVCDPLPGDHCLRPAGRLPDPRPLSALPGGRRHRGQHRDVYRREKCHPFHRV